MKKIAKVLLLAMIISVFASACGSTEPEVFDMDFTSSSSGVDLEGANIVYKVYLAESQADTFLGYEIDTIFADMAAERLDEVEKNKKYRLQMRRKCVNIMCVNKIYEKEVVCRE